MARDEHHKSPGKRYDEVTEIPLTRGTLFKIADRAAFDGDPEAAKEIFRWAEMATYLLSDAVERRPALFKRIARKASHWPILFNRHHETRKAADLLMKKLELGAESGINITGLGKSFSWETPAVQIAYHLVELVRVVQRHSLVESPNGSENLAPLAGLYTCGKRGKRPTDYGLSNEQLRALDEWGQVGPGSHLPPLSRDTAPQWAKAIGKPFRILFGRYYHDNPTLADLRRSVERKWSGGLGILRSRMLNAVKQAIESIAPLK